MRYKPAPYPNFRETHYFQEVLQDDSGYLSRGNRGCRTGNLSSPHRKITHLAIAPTGLSGLKCTQKKTQSIQIITNRHPVPGKLTGLLSITQNGDGSNQDLFIENNRRVRRQTSS
uniref:Uncharacterized protein n=1 Tax=Cacopsylla melanoneura TaxID=428564 RepID=A0A8D8RFC4_9HEMI